MQHISNTDKGQNKKLFSGFRVTAEINLHDSARSLQSIWTFVPDEDSVPKCVGVFLQRYQPKVEEKK